MHYTEAASKSRDGLDLFYRCWEPEKQNKAVICLVHGLGEHSGRYAHMAGMLGHMRYALLGFDLRGHGKSGGRRGHAPSIETLMQDIDVILEVVEQRFPGLPCFLYGHSLGAILVLNYTLRRRPAVDGVVAASCALRSSLESQVVKVTLAKVLGTLTPAVTLPSGLDPAALSRDPQVLADYCADPLVHAEVSFGMGKLMLAAIGWIYAHAAEFAVPLLLAHGTADQVAFPAGSQELAQLVPGDCTLMLWDGLMHEIHNEPEKAQVLAFTGQWLDARLA